MTQQTEDDIEVRGSGGVLMAVFRGYLGSGIMVEDDKVILGIQTDSHAIDLTMTKDEAKTLAAKLASAAK